MQQSQGSVMSDDSKHYGCMGIDSTQMHASTQAAFEGAA
jgi:hypothetical protein